MSNETKDRVWIELEKPRNAEHAKVICEKANRLMNRLGFTEGWHFHWDEKERQYWWCGDSGYITLSDRGHWFNLDYLGRE